MDRLCSLGDAIAQELQPPVPLPGNGARAALRGGGALGEQARERCARSTRFSKVSVFVYLLYKVTVHCIPKP